MAEPVVETPEVTDKKPRVLPEQKFWKRYSPHHEFPLSAVGSFALHFVGGGGLIMMAVLIGALIKSNHRPPEIGAVILGDEGRGDGRFEGLGDGTSPGDAPKEVIHQNQPQPPEQPTESPNERLVKPIVDNRISLPVADQAQLVDSDKVFNEAKKALAGQVVNPAKPANGGGGEGGRGIGVGNKSGPTGPASNIVSQRRKRWTMLFNNDFDGREYLRQLHALGAKVAIPVSDTEALVIHDLGKPLARKVESLDQFTGIMCWQDADAQSNQRLASALQLPDRPQVIQAYFPASLEERLLSLELTHFRKRHPNGKEHDIGATTFDVRRTGGRYEPTVKTQTLGKP